MTTPLLNLGARALQASQAALHVTGANIANANTAGYTRQRVELASAGGLGTGAGYRPRGVDVQTVTRAHNEFLTREARLTASIAAADDARSAQLQRLETVLPTGERGLGYAAGELLNAFVDVASRPEDISARQVVLARADDLAARLRAAAGNLDDLQRGVKEDVQATVASVNVLAARVAELNRQIAQAQGEHTPNDLLDQRDELIREIDQSLQLTAVGASDGSVGLFLPGGQPLVMGGTAHTLALAADAFDPSRAALSITIAGTAHPVPADAVQGGRLAGLMRFQSDDLVQARNLVGQMATALAARMNELQSLGLDLGRPPAAGAPLFATGAPRVLAAQTNARDAAGNPIAQPSIVVSDAKRLQASDYELRSDPAVPGQYLLTRLSDGLVRNVADGDTIDGFTFGAGTPAPGAGDRFLLQPVGAAARDMRLALQDPRALAAASPLTATPAAANGGTAGVQSLAVVSATVDPQLTASIRFTSGSGNYDWELRDASNALVSSGSALWTAGNPIALNGFELRLSGTPRSGDAFAVSPTRFPASNNGNALAFADLRDEAFVGEQVMPDGTVRRGSSFTDAYAQAIADIGVRMQGARSAAQVSASLAREAQAAQQAGAGVNLDEEAARLIQFQQSYEAAAKVLQIAQNVFDSLLQATGR